MRILYAQSRNLLPAIGKGPARAHSHPAVACLAFAAGRASRPNGLSQNDLDEVGGGYFAGAARRDQGVADRRLAPSRASSRDCVASQRLDARLSVQDRGGPCRTKFVCLNTRNPLRRGSIRTNSDIAQYARACGRVSVGGDLDKRPVNRPWKTGSRRRTGEPRPTGDEIGRAHV